MNTEELKIAASETGHPVALAILIIRMYPSLAVAAAMKTTECPPKVLLDKLIPGSEENVYRALDLLCSISNGCGADQAIEERCANWKEAVAQEEATAKAEGHLRAEALIPVLKANLTSNWLKAG